MIWTDWLDILADFLRYGGAVLFLLVIAAIVIAAAALTDTPEHRNRYELAAQDEAGDTHANWNLHRLDIPARPLRPEPRPAMRAAPNPRVRAISSVQAARQANLKPSFDSRAAHGDAPERHSA